MTASAAPRVLRPAPRATYRVQLHGGAGFGSTAGIADYLARLGVSHLYVSPCLQAAPGSAHGYDGVDPTRVSAELGGEEGLARLRATLDRHGLGLLLDIVPNHLAASEANPWWWDVLEKGPRSPHARCFDIDWDPAEPRLRGRVLIPVLGDHLGRVIERGEIRLRDGVLQVHERSFPVAAGTWGDDADPAPGARGREGRPGGALDAGRLLSILDRQAYRLAWWRSATQDLNYRRFFDIDALVGVRVEDPAVFEATHARILRGVADGTFDGLRVDHPDGLRRPAEYLERLRAAAPEAWIVVEKILEPGESLRSWPVDGTTGYEFLAAVSALFVDPASEKEFTALHAEITGEPGDFDDVARRAKEEVLDRILAAELRSLVHRFVAACEEHPRWRDFTRAELHEVLLELLVAFDVYRTYVDEDGRADPADVEVVDRAVEAVRRRRPELDRERLVFVRGVLLGDCVGPAATEARMRFQQLTGPVMAKGVEDTAFYRDVRFVASNEVGGSPGRFGSGSVDAFHDHCRHTARAWPRTLLALSTHDTKRSEDVRARLFVLSEMPERWASCVRRWVERNARHRRGPERPDRSLEYLLYQTLVGAHPLPIERARAYAEKASREARRHTSWRDPDPEYDAALHAFVEALYADEEFQDELSELASILRGPGRVTALAQKLLQLTAPGVPDVYQGTELWDDSLVDPDNRRPVDFGLRRRLLDLLGELDPETILARSEEGLPKLLVVSRALALRAERPESFGPRGGYRPLAVRGPAADHAVAFLRGEAVATVVPRWVVGLAQRGGGEGTSLELPDGRWHDVLTGGTCAGGSADLARLWARFPVALLVREAE